MPLEVRKYKATLEGRAMLVRKAKVVPLEAIVRGYITGASLLPSGGPRRGAIFFGLCIVSSSSRCLSPPLCVLLGSGWSEYKKSGTVHGITLPAGLVESQKLPEPLFTPSTKAEQGAHDENISPAQGAPPAHPYGRHIR